LVSNHSEVFMIGFDPNNDLVYNWLTSWNKTWLSNIPPCWRDVYAIAMRKGYVTSKPLYRITKKGVRFVKDYAACKVNQTQKTQATDIT
jgi:hypothetical protein